MKSSKNKESSEPRKQQINSYIEGLSAATFLIGLGIILLFPKLNIVNNIWILLAGIILVGGNVARIIYGIKMQMASIILGIFAILYWFKNLAGFNLPIIPILLIILGITIIINILSGKKRP